MICLPRNLPWARYHDDPTDDFNWRPTKAKFEFLKHHDFTCSCCGLRSRPTREVPCGYMELMLFEGWRGVLCTLCKQSQHVGRVVRDNRVLDHGVIVFCPDLSQGDVCQIAQYLGIAKLRSEPIADELEEFVNRLAEEGSQLAREELLIPQDEMPDGLTISEFIEVCNVISPAVERRWNQVVARLRYLPLKDFTRQYRYWDQHSPDMKSIPHYHDLMAA